MTCLAGEKWEVTPYHVWSAGAWLVGVAVLVAAVVVNEERLAWVALTMLMAAATYNMCAAVHAAAQTQREAFDLGREHEARCRAEQDVRRI